MYMAIVIGEVRQYHRSAGTEVLVLIRLLHCVVHIEVVGDGELGRSGNLHERVSIVAIDRKALAIERSVKRTIRIKKVDVALRIARQSSSCHPDGALVAVWSDVQN